MTKWYDAMRDRDTQIARGMKMVGELAGSQANLFTLDELTQGGEVVEWGYTSTTANHSNGIWRITFTGKKQTFEYVGDKLRMWHERDAYMPAEKRVLRERTNFRV